MTFVRRAFFLAAFLAVLGLSLPAHAHAVLENAEPAPQAVLPSGSGVRITLQFSEAIETTADSLRLFDPNGTVVPDLTVRVAGASLLGDLTTPITAQGTYTLAWRVISADGHPVSGAYVFSIGQATAANPLPAALTGLGRGPVVFYGVVRALDLLAVALLAGLLLAWWPFGRPVSRIVDIESGWARLTVAATIAVAVTSVLVLILQGDSVRDAPWWSTAGISAIGETFGTRFGQAWLSRAAFTVLAVTLRDRGPVAQAVPGIGLLLATSVRGHATGAAKPIIDVAADSTHLVGVSVWAAGVLVLLAVVRPAVRRAAAEERGPLWARVAERFSPMALVAAAVLLAGGTVSSFRRVPTWDGLVHSGYGRVLLAKIAVFAALLAFGAVNIFLIRPRLARDVTWPARLRRSLTGEACAMAVAFSLAGALTGMAPPATSNLNALSQQGAAGPYVVSVSLVPVGAAFDIHAVVADSNGLAARDVAETRIQLTESTRHLGPLSPPLSEAGPGHAIASQVALVRPGEWIVTVILRRGEFDEFRTSFTFHL